MSFLQSVKQASKSKGDKGKRNKVMGCRTRPITFTFFVCLTFNRRYISIIGINQTPPDRLSADGIARAVARPRRPAAPRSGNQRPITT
jgi:hypothetical protein